MSGHHRTLLLARPPPISVLFGGRWLLRYLIVFFVTVALTSTTRAQTQCVGVPVNGSCSSNQFLDVDRSCCVACTSCAPPGELTRCNRTHDAVCVPPCPLGMEWNFPNQKCIISDCGSCQEGQCLSLTQCLCDHCHTGTTCLIQKEECTDAGDAIDKGPDTSSSSLNPLTIGLIAIGVVIGIIVFSACFLLFGFCTTKQQRQVTENQGSENSESGLITSRALTNSTRSSYMSSMNSTTAYLNHQSMLELLRHSNTTPLHGTSGDSSNVSSPNSFRSSPKLVRTSPLAREKFHEKGQISHV